MQMNDYIKKNFKTLDGAKLYLRFKNVQVSEYRAANLRSEEDIEGLEEEGIYYGLDGGEYGEIYFTGINKFNKAPKPDLVLYNKNGEIEFEQAGGYKYEAFYFDWENLEDRKEGIAFAQCFYNYTEKMPYFMYELSFDENGADLENLVFAKLSQGLDINMLCAVYQFSKEEKAEVFKKLYAIYNGCDEEDFDEDDDDFEFFNVLIPQSRSYEDELQEYNIDIEKYKCSIKTSWGNVAPDDIEIVDEELERF